MTCKKLSLGFLLQMVASLCDELQAGMMYTQVAKAPFPFVTWHIVLVHIQPEKYESLQEFQDTILMY